MSRIIEIRSGGQSGADRGAMDAARVCGVAVSGWCPAGGWAEDYPTAPGVLELYPELIETPSSDVIQRTEWNIRDSTCAIVLNTRSSITSPGTDAGFAFNEKYGTPYFELFLDESGLYGDQLDCARNWLYALDDDAIVLGFGGPRESEYPGVYEIAFLIVEVLLAEFA